MKAFTPQVLGVKECRPGQWCAGQQVYTFNNLNVYTNVIIT